MLHCWQGFKWAVEQDEWQARVASIQRVFDVAARDMGKQAVDSQVVAAVWERLLPGKMRAEMKRIREGNLQRDYVTPALEVDGHHAIRESGWVRVWW